MVKLSSHLHQWRQNITISVAFDAIDDKYVDKGTVVTYGAITAIDTILDIVAIETYLFLAIATMLLSF